MSTQRRSVARNASAMLISQVVTWTLTLIFSIVLRRFLGPEGSGIIVIANSIWLVAGIFIGFGMDMYLTKEIARDRSHAAQLLGTSYVLRIAFYLLGILAVWGYSLLIGYDPATVLLIQVVGLSALFLQLSNASKATLQGLETMEYISISDIASKSVNMGLGVTVLLLGMREAAIAWVMVATTLVMFLMQAGFLHRKHHLRPKIHPELMRGMLLSSIPYMATVFGMVAYGELSVLTLSLQVSVAEVGWYGAANQIFGTMLFGAVVFSTVTFPIMARSHVEDPAGMPAVLRQNLALILIVSVPVGMGLFAVAQPLMVLLFGSAFAPSGSILQVMGIVLIFMYLNVLFGQYFNSIDQQKVWTVVVIVSAVSIVPLNFLLVPWATSMFGLGALGGAFSFLLTQIGQTVAGWFLVPRGTLTLASLRHMVLVFLAGILMTAAVWPVRDMFIGVPILVGAVVYPLVVLALRIISPEQMALLKQVGQTVLTKVRRRRPVEASATVSPD